jgi:hypothetical protein
MSAACWRILPPQINSLEDTGLSPLWLQDLILKVLYFRGYLTGHQDRGRDHPAVCRRDRSTACHIKQEKFIEVKSSQGGLGEGAYTPMALQVQASCAPVKRWNAVNMQVRPPCLSRCITKLSAAKRADG